MSPPQGVRILKNFPHYATARSIEEVDSRISADEFHRRFVLMHRPCVIRGATVDWRADVEWTSDHLRARVGTKMLGGGSGGGVIREPLVEYRSRRKALGKHRMSVDEFLTEVDDGGNELLQMYAVRLNDFAELEHDIGTFGFIDPTVQPSRFYSDRFFVSRRGYTDWHVHSGDETITVQLAGMKELLLLPPDARTFRVMLPRSLRGVWKCAPRNRGRAFASLRPYRVELSPGDAVYIPMHWWHAAEASDGGLNVTFARVFATPLKWVADPRISNVWFSLLIETLQMIDTSVGSRRPRHVRTVLRMFGLTARGAPALLRNGRNPVARITSDAAV